MGPVTEDDLRWASGNIDQLIGKIQQRTGESREAIESYLDKLASQGSSTVSSAVESVGSYAQEVTHRLRDHYGDVSEQAREGYYTAQDAIGRNPLPWMAVAFGVGVLTGVLVTGMSSSSNSSSRYRIF